MSAAPHWATYLLDEPLLIAGEEREIAIKQYGYDPTLAPPGEVGGGGDAAQRYNYWQRIYGRKLYDIEQLDEAQVVLAPFWKSSIRGFWNRSRRPTWQRR